MKNLLVELFVEELPPKALQKLGESFALTLVQNLERQHLLGASSKTTSFASPRRLAVHVTSVLTQAPDQPISQKLMPASVGLDAAGKATPALLKKLASLGAPESAIEHLKREGDMLFFNAIQPGAQLVNGLQMALNEAIAKLPIPKVMGYQLQDGWTTVSFVRPAHKLVALHGSDVVALAALGLHAGRETQGHRFEARLPVITLRDADSYAEQLKTEGAVIASFAERRAEIARQLQTAAAKAGTNLKPITDEALLDEVTALVERPNVLIGQFEQTFLQVPQECLILTMKANQKYFPLLDDAGKLTHRFLIVSNISPADASAVIGGNERVVRPRLADAKFFFDQDRKKPLTAHATGLDKVVYHNKLGTQGERVLRVAAIAKSIGQKLGGDTLAMQAEQAATLAKADLLTDMVGEFPELQGIMGRYYALNDGLSSDIADAIEDHYKPRFAGDSLPRNPVGICVALADKLETLVGLFGIGQQPSGDKDPFALRRHALGMIRMIVEGNLDLSIYDLVNQAFLAFPQGLLGSAHIEICEFITDRFSGLLREQGHTAHEIDAVLSINKMHLHLVNKQLSAVKAFARLPEAASLASANKRVSNILKKTESIQAKVDTTLLKESAEQALHEALRTIAQKSDKAFDAGDYTASLQSLAVLKTPIDTFFEQVMVNVDDATIRNNRLALLQQLHSVMNRVADLSRLAG